MDGDGRAESFSDDVSMGVIMYSEDMGIDIDINTKLDYLRIERKAKLNNSDKYMLSDFPITEEKREEWKIYRQALRDLPLNQNIEDISLDSMFKLSGVNWPIEPTP
tara:strand:+ start:76 stop:393 length:318 start_codon:yes stop_codon:yes gene_type:complete